MGRRPGARVERGRSKLRVGVFGGAFNPPHLGHVICACEALWQLELDEVVLTPVGQAPHRAVEPEPGRDVRHELCCAAAEGHEGLEVSRLEIDKDGPCYTFETLEALAAATPDRELTLIMGGDQARSLARWRRPERVLELAELAVAERDPVGRSEVLEGLGALVDAGRVGFFDMPRIDISSTIVRERIATGRRWRHLVPEGVARRIEELDLYRPAVGAGK